MIRHLLIGRYTLTELRRTLHPRAVLPVKLSAGVVSDSVMRTVLGFFLFYALMIALCVMVGRLGCRFDHGYYHHHGHTRQRGTRAWTSRTDGELRPLASCEQVRVNCGNVDRSARSVDRAGTAAS